MSYAPIIKLDSSHNESVIEIFEDNSLISNDLVVRAGQFSMNATFERWILTAQKTLDKPHNEYGTLSVNHSCEDKAFSVFSNIILTPEEVAEIRKALPTLTFIDRRKGVQHD